MITDHSPPPSRPKNIMTSTRLIACHPPAPAVEMENHRTDAISRKMPYRGTHPSQALLTHQDSFTSNDSSTNNEPHLPRPRGPGLARHRKRHVLRLRLHRRIGLRPKRQECLLRAFPSSHPNLVVVPCYSRRACFQQCWDEQKEWFPIHRDAYEAPHGDWHCNGSFRGGSGYIYCAD